MNDFIFQWWGVYLEGKSSVSVGGRARGGDEGGRGGGRGGLLRGVWTINLRFEYMRMEEVDLNADRASVSAASLQKGTSTSL